MSILRSSPYHQEARHLSSRPATRRTGTLPLELQASLKFALAMLIGLGGVLANLSTSAAGLILIVAVLVAGRALTVIARDPGDRTSISPTGEADWDAALASAWAVLAVALALTGSVTGAIVAGSGAVALAFLRLRTRYVL